MFTNFFTILFFIAAVFENCKQFKLTLKNENLTNFIQLFKIDVLLEDMKLPMVNILGWCH